MNLLVAGKLVIIWSLLLENNHYRKKDQWVRLICRLARQRTISRRNMPLACQMPTHLGRKA